MRAHSGCDLEFPLVLHLLSYVARSIILNSIRLALATLAKLLLTLISIRKFPATRRRIYASYAEAEAIHVYRPIEALDQCYVAPLDVDLVEELAKLCVSGRVLRDDDEAGSIPVKAVRQSVPWRVRIDARSRPEVQTRRCTRITVRA